MITMWKFIDVGSGNFSWTLTASPALSSVANRQAVRKLIGYDRDIGDFHPLYLPTGYYDRDAQIEHPNIS